MYLLIAALLIIAVLIYVLVAYFLKNSKDEEKTEWTDDKSAQIVHSAAQKADEIVAQAEIEGIKIAAESKLGANLFQKTYDEKLQKALDEAKQEFATELEKALKNYQTTLDNLQKKSLDQQQELETLVKQKINDTLLKFEENLSTYLTSAEQKSFEAINLELKSARQLIDTYKSQQLQLIDENIVAVLERTLSLVTRDKLSLKEQLDLVYEALEKAKVEKFFA